MGKVVKKLYQTCDFCKKEYELTGIDRNGQPSTLNTIDLPGYYRGDGSMNAPTVIRMRRNTPCFSYGDISRSPFV